MEDHTHTRTQVFFFFIWKRKSNSTEAAVKNCFPFKTTKNNIQSNNQQSKNYLEPNQQTRQKENLWVHNTHTHTNKQTNKQTTQ